MNLLGRLETLANAYCDHQSVQRGTVSRVVFGDQRRLDLVFSGSAGLTVANFEKAMLWFSANWPEALAWPEAIERPDPRIESGDDVGQGAETGAAA